MENQENFIPEFLSTQQVLSTFDISGPFFQDLVRKRAITQYTLAGRKLMYKYTELRDKLIQLERTSTRGANQYTNARPIPVKAAAVSPVGTKKKPRQPGKKASTVKRVTVKGNVG